MAGPTLSPAPASRLVELYTKNQLIDVREPKRPPTAGRRLVLLLLGLCQCHSPVRQTASRETGGALFGLYAHETRSRVNLLGLEDVPAAQLVYDSDWQGPGPSRCPIADSLRALMEWRLRRWTSATPLV